MAQTNTTTTVTTTTAVQTGTQLVVDSNSNTVNLGNYVTDVTLQPYIANRIVSFYAYNLRPNQRMHVFFDSVLVDQYCAPGIVPTSIADSSNFESIVKNGNWGDAITSDSTGQVAGQFNIPAGMFKTGDRILQLCDVTSLAQGSDAITTVASGSFTASNLSVTKQMSTLTTINPEISYVPVVNTVVTTSTDVSITTSPGLLNIVYHRDPIAQKLTIVTPNNQAGIFALAINVYFKQKSQVRQNGVTLFLCETTNGYPDGNKIIPFSQVHLKFDDVNVSDDSTVATKFIFDSPVFLNNNTDYAFVVKPDANDPDYDIFMAKLGDVDISTGYQVFSQPIVGTAFYGATTTQWTAIQNEYIKFDLFRANFTSATGTASFNNSNTEYISAYNVAYSNTSNGIIPGDYVYQSTNSSPTSVNTSIYGKLNYYDTIKNLLYVDNSTGLFTSNTNFQVHRFANSSVMTPNTTTIIAYGNTGPLYNAKLDAFVPQIASITPSGTSLAINFAGISNTYSPDSTNYKVNPGYETEFHDKERIIASKSNEVTNLSSAKSLTLNASFTTDSEYISPIIDTVRNQQLVIGNDIDPVGFNYNEFFNTSTTKSKYVSQIVTLAQSQDAQDLQVILTAYRPLSSDISVYVKYLNAEDTETFSQKTWTPLINKSYNFYSDPSNTRDMKEFTFVTPKGFGMIPTTGLVTCTNASAVVSGNGTSFVSEMSVGWYVNMEANTTFNESTRQILAVNSTSLTLNSPFVGNYTNRPIYLVAPPTTAWLSTNNTIQLTGTVTTSTTNNVITGSGTNFTGELLNSSIISVNGDKQKIVAITNSTSLIVGTPWSSSVSGANAYSVSPTGITYLNKDLNYYSTFKKFQVKIVLQSNDSSKVPLIDDLRCLALQL